MIIKMTHINFSSLFTQAPGFFEKIPSINRLPKIATQRQLATALVALSAIALFATAFKYTQEARKAAFDRLLARLTSYVFGLPPKPDPEDTGDAPSSRPVSPSASRSAPSEASTGAAEALVEDELSEAQTLLVNQKEALIAAINGSSEDILPSSDEKSFARIASRMDGSCLFHSIASHLIYQKLLQESEGAEPFSSSIDELIQSGLIPTHTAIRAHTADCLHETVALDPTLQAEAAKTIREFNEEAQNRRSDEEGSLKATAQLTDNPQEKKLAEQLLKNLESAEEISQDDFISYIQKLKQPSFFGGSAELYLLAKFYDVTIRIYVENRLEGNATSQYEFFYEVNPLHNSETADRAATDSPAEAREQKPICHLLYSPGGPHYDFLMPLALKPEEAC